MLSLTAYLTDPDQSEFHLVLTQKFLTGKEPLCQETKMCIRNNYASPFYFFLRLIQESHPLQFSSCFQKHPGRCSFSTEKQMGDGNSGQPLLRGRVSNNAADHQEDSVSVANTLSVDATRFSLEHRNHCKSKGAKGHRDEATT